MRISKTMIRHSIAASERDTAALRIRARSESKTRFASRIFSTFSRRRVALIPRR